MGEFRPTIYSVQYSSPDKPNRRKDSPRNARVLAYICGRIAAGAWSPSLMFAPTAPDCPEWTDLTHDERADLAERAFALVEQMQSMGGIEAIRSDLDSKYQAIYEAAMSRRMLPRAHNQEGKLHPDLRAATAALHGRSRLRGLDQTTQIHLTAKVDPLTALSQLSPAQLDQIARTGQLPPGIEIPGLPPPLETVSSHAPEEVPAEYEPASESPGTEPDRGPDPEAA